MRVTALAAGRSRGGERGRPEKSIRPRRRRLSQGGETTFRTGKLAARREAGRPKNIRIERTRNEAHSAVDESQKGDRRKQISPGQELAFSNEKGMKGEEEVAWAPGAKFGASEQKPPCRRYGGGVNKRQFEAAAFVQTAYYLILEHIISSFILPFSGAKAKYISRRFLLLPRRQAGVQAKFI